MNYFKRSKLESWNDPAIVTNAVMADGIVNAPEWPRSGFSLAGTGSALCTSNPACSEIAYAMRFSIGDTISVGANVFTASAIVSNSSLVPSKAVIATGDSFTLNRVAVLVRPNGTPSDRATSNARNN